MRLFRQFHLSSVNLQVPGSSPGRGARMQKSPAFIGWAFCIAGWFGIGSACPTSRLNPLSEALLSRSRLHQKSLETSSLKSVISSLLALCELPEATIFTWPKFEEVCTRPPAGVPRAFRWLRTDQRMDGVGLIRHCVYGILSGSPCADEALSATTISS